MYRKEEYRTDIILIEDSGQDTVLMMECLTGIGSAHRVTSFTTALAADEWLFRKGAHAARELVPYPLFIIIDVRMPIMTGLQLLHSIRGNEATKLIPIVMFTDSQGIDAIHEGYDCGANAYIVKPMLHEEFEATLRSTLTFWMELNRSPYRDSKFMP